MTKFVDRYVARVREIIAGGQKAPAAEEYRQQVNSLIDDLVSRAEELATRPTSLAVGEMTKELRRVVAPNGLKDRPNKLIGHYSYAFQRYTFVSDAFEQETRADSSEKMRLLKYRVGTAV